MGPLYRKTLLCRHWPQDPVHDEEGVVLLALGPIERLHNDYKLLNNYVVNEYNISDSLVIPDGINEEPIFDIYPFDIVQLSADFKTDFEPYSDGEAFFFTQKMADEYIKMATGKCLEEIKALENGSFTIDEMEWAWDKNPPKQSMFQRLRNKLIK